MADSDFQITVTTQPAMTKAGKLALARLIAAHIRQGIARGTWAVLNGRAVPRAMLHFYEEEVIIGEEVEA